MIKTHIVFFWQNIFASIYPFSLGFSPYSTGQEMTDFFLSQCGLTRDFIIKKNRKTRSIFKQQYTIFSTLIINLF